MRVQAVTSEGLPSYRFPVDPWRLVEREMDTDTLGVTETLFAIGNGYLGMRANPSEGRDAHSHGTFLNGFHETWPIHHAEEAHAFAKTGQTIVNVPDAKLMKLYVDDEPLLLGEADLESYERVLDFKTGEYSVDLIWRTPAGKRLRVRSTRMTSLEHRHLALLTFEIEMLEGSAPLVLLSQLLNRQDGGDEYHVTEAALGEGLDPRKSRRFDRRVLVPEVAEVRDEDRSGGAAVLGYRTSHSGMTMACAYQHDIDTTAEYSATTSVDADVAKTVFTFDGRVGVPIRINKYVSYHSSKGVPAQELADRCLWTIRRARSNGVDRLRREQQSYLNQFWENADIVVDGNEATQQAIRWHLFHLAQASARTNEVGIPAKATTGGGYDGHYFWDTEIYVIPFLAYTNPSAAQKLLRFRWKMLDSARKRARELSQKGALYPWRTISGEEASAYYAAGTAQYHINAAVAHAFEKYHRATGDDKTLFREGAEILVETARLWQDLGFFALNGERRFRIHGVTGPDEYTTVVNDNLYTNVMAQANMRFAIRTVRKLQEADPGRFQQLVRATDLDLSELDDWQEAADAMYLPFDKEMAIHSQDEGFLDREIWDCKNTPDELYPLLLHFHPLVIYRHQVLKQADVVLAMYLHPEHFEPEQKRRNFDYYDPLTTGDSSLSACIQAIVAAEVGRDAEAFKYFQEALYIDLLNLHGNSADGIHVANNGGIWAALMHGFGGVADDGEAIELTPRLPKDWNGLRLRMVRHGVRAEIEINHTTATVRVLAGGVLPIRAANGEIILVSTDDAYEIELPTRTPAPAADEPTGLSRREPKPVTPPGLPADLFDESTVTS